MPFLLLTHKYFVVVKVYLFDCSRFELNKSY